METLEAMEEEFLKEWKSHEVTKAFLNSLRQERGQMLEDLLKVNDHTQELVHKGMILGLDKAIDVIINL